MSFLTSLTGGIRSLFRKKQAEREMDEELRAYIDAAAQEKMRSGMTREQALRAARVEMGCTDAVKEGIRSTGWESMLETLWHDLRYGVRQLKRSPGFTSVAIITLALGIGANTAIFSLIDAVMLRALPVDDPSLQRLARILGETLGATGVKGEYGGTDASALRDLRTPRGAPLAALVFGSMDPESRIHDADESTDPRKIAGVATTSGTAPSSMPASRSQSATRSASADASTSSRSGSGQTRFTSMYTSLFSPEASVKSPNRTAPASSRVRTISVWLGSVSSPEGFTRAPSSSRPCNPPS